MADDRSRTYYVIQGIVRIVWVSGVLTACYLIGSII